MTSDSLRSIGLNDWADVISACVRVRANGGESAVIANLVSALMECLHCTCLKEEVCQYHDSHSAIRQAAKELRSA